MGLMFAGPDEGFELECDSCNDQAWSNRWQDAGSLVVEAASDGWTLDEYEEWDGVSYADAECPACNGNEDYV